MSILLSTEWPLPYHEETCQFYCQQNNHYLTMRRHVNSTVNRMTTILPWGDMSILLLTEEHYLSVCRDVSWAVHNEAGYLDVDLVHHEEAPTLHLQGVPPQHHTLPIAAYLQHSPSLHPDTGECDLFLQLFCVVSIMPAMHQYCISYAYQTLHNRNFENIMLNLITKLSLHTNMT